MAEPKVQLVAPLGNLTVPGMNVTGVVTATLGDVGVAGSIIQGNNIDIGTGIITATSFVGDQIGTYRAASLTGSPDLVIGVVTASSYVGDVTGAATSIIQGTNTNAGTFNATTFVGNVTGNITGDVIGHATGIGGSIKQGVNLNVGVATAVWYGDGSSLTGLAATGGYAAQYITATGAETIIDLSYGNLIYYKGEADTTVGFASTSSTPEEIIFVRDTDPNYSISYSTGGVTFDGTGDYLTAGSSSDFTMGTGDFTVECWIKKDALSHRGIWQISDTSGGLKASNYKLTLALGMKTNQWQIYGANLQTEPTYNYTADTWYHTAYVRNSGVSKLYINGEEIISQADTTDYDGTYIAIGGYYSDSYLHNGEISNFRIVKGTALYTSNFVPPSTALTNITNTKLLCCQSDSSTTTAAVTPGTITANGDPTAGAQTVALSGSLSATITWPDRVRWNDDTTPTLVSNDYSGAFQIFHLLSVDSGLTYNAWEEMQNDSLGGSYELWTWGQNQSGELGQNQGNPFPSGTAWYSSPAQLGTETKWSQANGPAGITFDKKLWVMGNNAHGQLGQNDGTQRSSPTQIPGTTWTSSMPGRVSTLMTKSDNTLWTVGSNEGGQLGLNVPTDVKISSPTQIPGTWGTDPNKIATGYNTTGAIKTDGTLWMWGANQPGQLGLNDRTQYSSPKQVGTDSTWRSISHNMFTSTATKTDGTLWSWGTNSTGSLGLNNETKYSSPVQVGTDTTWSDIVPMGGWYTNGAIKTDGTLWVWGHNQGGGLGQNQAQAQLAGLSSPTQVPGTTWSKVSPGDDGSHLALKTDNTLWVWGHNNGGILGLNSQVAMSSPVQIPGTNWISITNIGHILALKST